MSPPGGGSRRWRGPSWPLRPARKALRPARTASFMASAMSTGLLAAATAVFMSTPSQPSSSATAASDAVPTPASDDDRNAGSPDDDLEVVGVADALTGADGRGQRHDGSTAGVFELATDDGVVRAVGQDGEALFDEHLGRGDGLFVVGEEGLFVADDLELDDVGDAELTGQTQGTDGVVSRVAARGVGQKSVTISVDPTQKVVFDPRGSRDEVPRSRSRCHSRPEPLWSPRRPCIFRCPRDEAGVPLAAGEGPGILLC